MKADFLPYVYLYCMLYVEWKHLPQKYYCSDLLPSPRIMQNKIDLVAEAFRAAQHQVSIKNFFPLVYRERQADCSWS